MTDLATRLREAREALGLSQSELARKVGVTPQSIQSIEAGKVDHPRSILRIAKALNVDAAWLLDDRGYTGSSHKQKKMTLIVGFVGGGQEIYPVDDHALGEGLDQIETPAGAGPDDVAVIVRGESMWPRYQNGDVLVYRRHDGNISDLLGEECVVQDTSGRCFVKWLQPGRQEGRFNLESFNAPPMENVEIEWAGVVGVIVRHGARR